MAKHSPSKSKVIDIRTARASKHVPEDMHKAVANSSTTSSAPRGGFLDTWLKGHEDSQALVQENLSLKAQKRHLEEERQSLIPSLAENLVYYGSLIFAIGVLLSLIMLAGS